MVKVANGTVCFDVKNEIYVLICHLFTVWKLVLNIFFCIGVTYMYVLCLADLYRGYDYLCTSV
jgi:hypothetical protein